MLANLGLAFEGCKALAAAALAWCIAGAATVGSTLPGWHAAAIRALFVALWCKPFCVAYVFLVVLFAVLAWRARRQGRYEDSHSHLIRMVEAVLIGSAYGSS